MNRRSFFQVLCGAIAALSVPKLVVAKEEYGWGLIEVPIDKIINHSAFRPYDPEYINKLMQSIYRYGLINPPVVNGKLHTIDGFYRILAVKKLGYKTIKVNRIRPRGFCCIATPIALEV